MIDSEITTTILRQIRDQLQKQTDRLEAGFSQLDARMLVSETVLRDVYGQLLVLNRHVKTKNDPAIADLLKRVAKLEKKVG